MPSFSPEQNEIIHTWGVGLSVLAGAGSGKTTTLVAKCAKLLERKPDSRIAAVSFTERSASDLRDKLSDCLVSLDPHWVTTIHGLCAAIIREYPREAGLDGEESILSETEVQLYWEKALESLWIDDLPGPVHASLENLMNRESKSALSNLLKRMRELSSFGLFEFMEKSGDPATRDLKHVGRFVLDKFERIKRRNGYLDFADLETAAERALSHATVRTSYHKRFDLVLVDEFQDTNPLQAKIIRNFAKEDLSNLCVVGDPKQSIYRFRDADVSVFEEFCSQLPIRKSLTWNFRSVPEIIEFTNGICQKAFDSCGLRFDALIPKRESVNRKDPVMRLDITEPNELAQWIQLQVKNGVPLQDFALLLRKIRGNEKWLRALSSAGIPIAVGSGGLFWEDPRIRELVAFLKWWDNPAHSLSGAVFLRAPWVSIPDIEIDRWVKIDPTFKEPFFNSNHPIAKRLGEYRGLDVRPGELLLALLEDKRVEEELGAQLLGLWHRVEEWSSNGLDFHSVVTELSEAIEEKRREREIPAPRNLGQLSVLTLHSSKGLEFNHVILIDFNPKTRASDFPLLFWDRREGIFLGARDEDGDRDRNHPQEKRWRDIERKKNLEESMRLFYVALTRAREQLLLVCLPADEKKSSLNAAASIEEPYLKDDWRAWLENEKDLKSYSPKFVSRELCQRAESNSALNTGIYRSVFSHSLEIGRPRHSVTEWNLLSRCPRAYEWTYVRIKEVEKQKEEESEEEATLREKFQNLGNEVHECLAKGDYERLSHLESAADVPSFSVKPLVSWVKNSPWMNAGATGILDVWTELPFEIPVENCVLVGSIDRVVLEKKEEEKYVILDFKVTEKIKSVSSLIEAYQTQIDLYSYALEKLEPNLIPGQIEARLVNITKGGVQIVPVHIETQKIRKKTSHFTKLAHQIINGMSGQPQVGPLCRFCEFRPHCSEGAKYLSRDSESLDD